MKEGIFGVLNNIICLYADVKISEVLDLLTRRIFDEVKKTYPGVKISIPTQQLQAEYAILSIESRLAQILCNQEWTWDKILADAKSTCGTSSNERSFLTAKNVQPEKAAQHFQVYSIFNFQSANNNTKIWIAGPDQSFGAQDSRAAFDIAESRSLWIRPRAPICAIRSTLFGAILSLSLQTTVREVVREAKINALSQSIHLQLWK